MGEVERSMTDDDPHPCTNAILWLALTAAQECGYYGTLECTSRL